MSGNLDKGLCFENQANSYLTRQGLCLLQSNFRCRVGEIDLIMRDRNTICFIEVKYRKSSHFGGAAYSLTPNKQRKLVKAAGFYIAANQQLAQQPLRFDALLIQRQSDGSHQFNWIKNAFYAE